MIACLAQPGSPRAVVLHCVCMRLGTGCQNHWYHPEANGYQTNTVSVRLANCIGLDRTSYRYFQAKRSDMSINEINELLTEDGLSYL